TIISEVFEKTEPVISEFTFTNVFIWRHSYQFQVSFLDNILLILACPEPDKHFFMPPAGENISLEVLDTMLSFMLKEELRGKKLRKKKNHLNYFLKNFDFVFEPLNDKTIKLCFEMQEEWCNLKDCAENPTLSSEDFAAFEALYHWKQLRFDGGVILINGKVEAFSLGERLNKKTAVVHVEKANPKTRGLYPAINQVCCKNLWSGYEYINREQDMGQKGLRQAKLSYNPAFLVEKYTITPGKNF
ncbi:MAG TPA: DUF2156 domain-containing protein, partial [Deltaproteobacteria bacterium]|nr:DUF2156 domain-containing protein [Deltaproteobacteria bacterium]